jgi:hypothetical protein
MELAVTVVVRAPGAVRADAVMEAEASDAIEVVLLPLGVTMNV